MNMDNTNRKHIEYMAKMESQYNGFLAKVRGQFKEPQRLKSFIGNVVTFVTKEDNTCVSGTLESVDGDMFYMSDYDSMTPWRIDDIRFFYLGQMENFEKQHGYPLPTVEAIDYLLQHRTVKVPCLTMYDFLYKEGFVPLLMDGTVYDKSLLEFIVTYGYSRYMEWVTDKVGSQLDGEQADMIKRLTVMCDMFRGVNEDIAMNLANNNVKCLIVGKEVDDGE